MSGNNRIANGKVAQSKTKGKAFLTELYDEYQPEKLANEGLDGEDE